MNDYFLKSPFELTRKIWHDLLTSELLLISPEIPKPQNLTNGKINPQTQGIFLLLRYFVDLSHFL